MRFLIDAQLPPALATAIKLSRHSSMDAGIQSQGCER